MRFIVLVLTFLSGCAYREHNPNPKKFPVVIDNSFDSLQIEKIQKALIRWEEKTNINLDIQVLDVSGDRIRWSYDEITTIYYAEEGWQKKVYQSHVKRKSTLGLTTFPSKDIFIRNVFKMFKTSMHEFGHVLLGPDHVYNNYDIMYPYVLSSLSDISWRDIRIARKNYSEYLK